MRGSAARLEELLAELSSVLADIPPEAEIQPFAELRGSLPMPAPARVVAGQRASDEFVRQVERELGLNDPLYVQYGRFLLEAAQLDFGESYHYRERVSTMIAGRIGTTMTLGVCAILFALIAG